MALWSYQAPEELTDEQYLCWQTLLESRTGISFLQHKSILQKGLSQRMREAGYDDYEIYYQWVSKVPEGAVEWTRLVDRISIKETSFFREPQSYDLVRTYLLERLESLAIEEKTLDIWSVGCATGEEPYSLAMVANDVIDYLAVDVFLGVLATDISNTALSTARQGRYASRKLDGIPIAIKNKYFSPRDGGGYQIVSSLKQQLCFVQGNMMELERTPPMLMDVIFCQNVLVYFQRWRHKEVLDNLVRHLKPGGLLVVGPGEVTGWQHPQMSRSTDEMVQAYIRQETSN